VAFREESHPFRVLPHLDRMRSLGFGRDDEV
jgi:hypothetical protein